MSATQKTMVYLRNREATGSPMSVLNEQLEQSVGNQFFEWLNTEKGTNYSFARRAGEAPDLVYTSGAEELFVEITGAYCDVGHAEFLWKGARGATDAPDHWDGVNPDKTLAQAVANCITEKSAKRYGGTCILLVNIPPGVTPAEELARLLPYHALPSEIPFAGIYVVGRFPFRQPHSGGYRVIPVKELSVAGTIH